MLYNKKMRTFHTHKMKKIKLFNQKSFIWTLIWNFKNLSKYLNNI